MVYKFFKKKLRFIVNKLFTKEQKRAIKNFMPKKYLRLNPDNAYQKSKIDLLNYGFINKSRRTVANYKPRKNSVLYLLHHSLPYDSTGYSIRTQEILSVLSSNGVDVTGVTRLGFPWDLKTKAIDVPSSEKVRNVKYLRLPPDNGGYRQIPLGDYLDQYLDRLLSLAKDFKPSLIHAASNYINGSVGVKAAQILGIPSIYEVRGLWELTRASRHPWWAKSEEYAMCVKMETEVCLNASKVITITPILKEYLIHKRGVPDWKIEVVPNGVNSLRFKSLNRDCELENRFNLTGKNVIGFVGSFNRYEGLDLFFKAVKTLFKERDDFRILLVGDGPYFDELKAICRKLKLDDKVIFTGRVPYEEVDRYYSLIDIAPFPRIGALVCELVSPLKPFEAMAMGKCVVVSNVAALADIVEDGKTGFVFIKDNRNDLTRVLRLLLDNPELRKNIAENGRSWVLSNRDWAQLGDKVQEIYNDLISNVK